MRKVCIHKIAIFSLVLSSCFAFCLFFSGCQSEESSPSVLSKRIYDTSPSQSQEIEHNMVDYRVGIEIDSMSDCLNTGLTTDITDVPFNLDCAKWIYTPDKCLHIHHANAGFNCCPVIDKRIEVHADTITVTEIEVSGDCDCLCLFDLYYTISNLRVGIYHVMIVEPYLQPGDTPLEFTIDLRQDREGEYCLERNYYPWGE